MTTVAISDRLKVYANFVKLEHTIFSLPLIYAGALVGGHGRISWSQAAWILLAAAGGRVLAMGLNRIIDAELDARNPRTKNRELPRGVMHVGEAWGVVAIAGAVYLVSAAALSRVCLWWSPLPVVLFVIYPYLKRVTALAHLGLGLAWSMAPLGGYLATAQSLSGIGDVYFLVTFSLLWVAGFDIIYATMDEAFDREFGLYSLPVAVGKRRALRISAMLHACAFVSLAIMWNAHTSPIALAWLMAIGAVLAWEQIAAPRKPEFAFFQLNALIGFLVLGFVITAV